MSYYFQFSVFHNNETKVDRYLKTEIGDLYWIIYFLNCYWKLCDMYLFSYTATHKLVFFLFWKSLIICDIFEIEIISIIVYDLEGVFLTFPKKKFSSH